VATFWAGYEPGRQWGGPPWSEAAPACSRTVSLVPESNDESTKSGESRQPAARPETAAPEASARPPRPPLRALRILADAARVGRSDPVRILAVSVVVTVASVLAEAAAEHSAHSNGPWQAGLAAVVAEGIGVLGTVLLSGFLSRLAGEAGRGRVTIGHVVRTLPWGRLVLADLIVVVLVVLGLAALVIPGLILANLLAIVGPLIEIEDQPVRAALRRSGRLVRPYFWWVGLLGTVPVLLVSGVESAGPEPSTAPQLVEALAIRGGAGGVLEAAVGLILVQLCYRLIALDAAATAAAAATRAGQGRPPGRRAAGAA